MIIVSQNKKNIINFNNICKICVNKWNDKDFTVDCLDTTNFESMLGEYKTEERAKEILQEIIKFYEDTKQKMMLRNISLLNMDSFDFVYEMPKE